MRLPQATASVSTRLGYSRYLMRRLRRAKLLTEEQEVRDLSEALRTAEDFKLKLEEDLYNHTADRDAFDDELDDIVKRHRRALEGRSINANRQRPYTAIYPKGVQWYLNSPLDDQEERHRILMRAYEEFLPEGDPIRMETHLIEEALGDWKEAFALLSQAEVEVSMARVKLRHTVEEWEQGLKRIFHELSGRLTRPVVERFFPKVSRHRKLPPQGVTSGHLVVPKP